MKKHFKLFALAAPLFTSLSASAMTIDFNEFATDSSALNIGAPISSKGFIFSAGPNTVFSVWGKTNSWNADPGGAAIFSAGKITMKQITGAPFSLYSIDVDDALSGSFDYGKYVTFTFHYVGGTTAQKRFNIDRVRGLQTFVLSEYNLLSVDWEPNASTVNIQFDNVKVNVDCGITAPATSTATKR